MKKQSTSNFERFENFFLEDAFRDALIDRPEWSDYREIPANFFEFCILPEYLGLGEDIYPSLVELGDAIFKRNVLEVVLLFGIGAGKSFLAQVLVCYMAHRILCLKDPFKFFNIASDKPIAIMNFGITAKQARDVVFSGVRSLMLGSQWFKKHLDKKQARLTELEFFHGEIPMLKIISGNSTETAHIGLNLIMGVIDEADFYQEKGNTSVAENIFDTVKARINSRFGGGVGMAVAITSPRLEDGFANKKYKEGLVFTDAIFSAKGPTWKIKQRGKQDERVFIFNRSDFSILSEQEMMGLLFLHKKEYEKVAYSLVFDDEFLDKEYLIIPMDYFDTFRRAPEKALRDLAAEPNDKIEAFIKLRHFIDKAFCTQNRVSKHGDWDLSKPNRATPLFIHVDLARNKDGKGDAAGIAVCRCIGFDATRENMPVFEFPWVERITAGSTGEIKFSEIRARIISLKDAGWEIGGVSLDGYQSVETFQKLKERHIKCDYISCDTSLLPYETLKEGLYSERVFLPSVMIDDERNILQYELYNLELVKGKKVDHPSKGSKDVADAVAGALYNATLNVRPPRDRGSRSLRIR